MRVLAALLIVLTLSSGCAAVANDYRFGARQPAPVISDRIAPPVAVDAAPAPAKSHGVRNGILIGIGVGALVATTLTAILLIAAIGEVSDGIDSIPPCCIGPNGY